MAEVWAARVEGPGGFVKSLALKFILESFTGDTELERLFLNEARVAARLQHANLVSVFDFDRVSDDSAGNLARYYIAMERVDGHDLRRVLQVARHKGHRVSSGIALHIAGEVLKGLRYVHEWREEWGLKPLGLVHRDVSPHNILVGMGGEVKLSDFGIAKATAQSLGTQSGMIRGKLAYASPEQLRSEPVDHRADQFGLGVTLWETLADRRLFDGASEGEIVGKVLRCEIPSLQDAGIDPAVDRVVRRMLAGRPADRFSSTGEALAAVLATPGYVADAAVLVQLMRDLFAAQTVLVPPTVPLHLADPPSVGGLAETSQLERGPRADAPATAAAAQGDSRPSAASTARPSWRPAEERGATFAAARGADSSSSSLAIPGRVDPGEAVTGSAYVSDHSPATPGPIDEPGGRPQARRIVWALVAGVFLVAGGFALVMRGADESDDSESGGVPEARRPSGPEPVRQVEAVRAAPGGVQPAAADSTRPQPFSESRARGTQATPPSVKEMPDPPSDSRAGSRASSRARSRAPDPDPDDSTRESAKRSTHSLRRSRAALPTDRAKDDDASAITPRARERPPSAADTADAAKAVPGSRNTIPNGAPILE